MYQNWHIDCGIFIKMKNRGDFLFDTITDAFMSLIGITILLICFNTLFATVFKSLFAKRIISYASLMVFILFVIGGLLFEKQSEELFYIGFLIFLVFFFFLVLIHIFRNFAKSVKESIAIQETEKQCRSCEFFEECEECFKRNCPDYVKAKHDCFNMK